PGRGTAAGLLLVVAGAATLVAVKWGLKDDGLTCVAVLLAALTSARMLLTGPGTASA
ncbi:MAG: acyltransferase, partial [Mycolicibacter arupensis]